MAEHSLGTGKVVGSTPTRGSSAGKSPAKGRKHTKLLKLNYEAVHRFVDGYPNASWNGWSLELFKADKRAWAKKNGAYRNGTWGFLTRVEPDAKGIWTFRV
jgi:hypothetical protein